MKNQIIKEILETQEQRLRDKAPVFSHIWEFPQRRAVEKEIKQELDVLESFLNRMSKETLDSVKLQKKNTAKYWVEGKEVDVTPFENGFNQAVSDLENNIKKFNDD
jgi:predicted translin family RNA/ssDNA-binding protein